MSRSLPTALALASLALGCEGGGGGAPARGPGEARTEETCLIRCDEIHYGTSEPDQTPPLDEPEAVPAAEALDLEPEDPVIGLVVGEDARAYPLRVLQRHEVVNDSLGGRRVAVVHAPLLGVSSAFDLEASRVREGLGNSSGRWNGDAILYDRGSGSLWSPMQRRAVAGERAGDPLVPLPSAQATLAAWTAAYPGTSVLTTDTGHREVDYDGDAYAWYARDPERLLSPVRYVDLRLPRKDRVLGVRVGDAARAYRLADLPERGLVRDRVGGREVVILSDRQAGVTAAYLPALVGDREAGGPLDLVPSEAPPALAVDRRSGTPFDALGRALDGPLAGRRLASPDDARLAYWFGWAAFNPQTDIHGPGPGEPGPGALDDQGGRDR